MERIVGTLHCVKAELVRVPDSPPYSATFRGVVEGGEVEVVLNSNKKNWIGQEFNITLVEKKS